MTVSDPKYHMFQFLNGSIKGINAQGFVTEDASFQFLNGSIKGLAFLLITLTFIVSIPKRFD